MTEERQGEMESESGGRAVSCHCSLGTRVNKESSSGAFLSLAAEDPSAECGEGSVASSRHDNLPKSPSMFSRNKVGKVAGVSTIGVGLLVPGTWYVHIPFSHSLLRAVS